MIAVDGRLTTSHQSLVAVASDIDDSPERTNEPNLPSKEGQLAELRQR